MGRPDFFILGAQRAGTTSLAAYLNHHPNVSSPQCRRPVQLETKEDVQILIGKEKLIFDISPVLGFILRCRTTSSSWLRMH